MITETWKPQLSQRRLIPFNQDWLFSEGNTAGAHLPSFSDTQWRLLDVPHDWSIEKSFDPDMPHGGSQGYLPRWTIGWYRKHFTLDTVHRNQLLYIQFDGIHQNSEIWLNGHYLGKRPYGYVSFQYDITPYLHWDQENILAVKVDNTIMPSDRWYSGAGIYRNVQIISCNHIHVAEWGSYITTSAQSTESVQVHVEITLVNEYETEQTCLLRNVIYTADHAKRLEERETPVTLRAGEKRSVTQQMTIRHPLLWSPKHPSRYELYTSIISEGLEVDGYITTFGVREIRFDPQEGMFLNGEPIKLKGVNIHHDLGCLGAAYQNEVMERRLKRVKEMGCNAIRFSHNPMAPELLDLCDQMGFLVIDEGFDKWKSLYYEQLFDEWWERDLNAMLLRDRNHPCVIMWSVCNEVEQQGQESMLAILEMLVKHCRLVDPTRPVTCALEPHNWPMELRHGSIEDKVEHTKRLAAAVDILSLNYQEQWYEAYKQAMPDVIILGTETFPYYRGKDKRVKGYEPINPWFDVVKHDYVIGQFVWAGIDYLGESSFPSKGWGSGLIDTCGNRKPTSYLQESLWSDIPMVHLAVIDDMAVESPTPQWTLHWKSPEFVSHWNFAHYGSKLLRIVTFTNCDTVELIINDESYGQKQLSHYPDHLMTWYVPYTPGRIEAIGRVNNEIVSRHQLNTAGQPSRLVIESDRTQLQADGWSIAHLTISVTDEHGIIVPYAQYRINIELVGEGTLAGIDNGNLISDESFKGNHRTTHHGKCLAIVRSTRQPGSLHIQVSAEGLTGDQLTLPTLLVE